MNEAFEEHRPALLALAYRMLGSVAEAEDIVQEAYLRWRDATGVESPRSWLFAVVSRLCVDHLRSARVRREQYLGPWLPEPLIDAHSPEDSAELADSLSFAFLLLLERLGPEERAAFLLREVFDYDYADVSAVLNKSEAACRQLVHRAKERIGSGRTRFPASREQQEAVLRQFVAAITSGEVEPLMSVLAQDATLYSDGGGKAIAAINPIQGRDRVARFLSGVARKGGAGANVHFTWANGQPAIRIVRDGILESVTTLDIDAGRVSAIYIVRNPDKLRHIA